MAWRLYLAASDRSSFFSIAMLVVENFGAGHEDVELVAPEDLPILERGLWQKVSGSLGRIT